MRLTASQMVMVRSSEVRRRLARSMAWWVSLVKMKVDFVGEDEVGSGLGLRSEEEKG